MPFRPRDIAAGTLFLCAASLPAQATLYDVTLFWPHHMEWQGVVDTTTDTFTLTSWTNILDALSEPILDQMPIVFTAQTTSGFFDVPDDWNGTIGNNWGFVSNSSFGEIDWVVDPNLRYEHAQLGWGSRSNARGGFIDFSYRERSLGWVAYDTFSALTADGVRVSVIEAPRALPPVPAPAGLPLVATLMIGAGLFIRKRRKHIA
ncbi:hypothetical protein [Aestuariibius sp. HNIBRBA575]|uniref:hypothetical protein n=1 Tax=Aestuariibius sp. HNIBRBA575 TaxID=3233343 RepID=UPI0034A563A8